MYLSGEFGEVLRFVEVGWSWDVGGDCDFGVDCGGYIRGEGWAVGNFGFFLVLFVLIGLCKGRVWGFCQCE